MLEFFVSSFLQYPLLRIKTEFFLIYPYAWKVWTDTTIYMNCYATEDLLHKVEIQVYSIFGINIAQIFLLMMMMGVLGMTINAPYPYVFEYLIMLTFNTLLYFTIIRDSRRGFVISFIVCRVVILIMYAWVIYWIKESRTNAQV